MFVSAIIAAGGRGQRFGGALPKQLLDVDGRPILERSVGAFLAHPPSTRSSSRCRRISRRPAAVLLRRASKPLRIVAGGARRQDSVANAFAAADRGSDMVVIHDAARPFVTRGPHRAHDRRGRGVRRGAGGGAAPATR